MRLVAKFTIPGKPVAKGRPRMARGRVSGRLHAYTPAKTRDAEETIRQYAQIALRNWKATGPIEVYCQFYFNSNPRTEVQIWESDCVNTKGPDVDNLAKLVLDSLAPWLNDKLVVRLTAEKEGKDV